MEALTGLTLFPFLRNLPHHIIRPAGVDKENLDSAVTPDLHPQPGLNRREFNVWLSGLRGLDNADDNLGNARRRRRRSPLCLRRIRWRWVSPVIWVIGSYFLRVPKSPWRAGVPKPSSPLASASVHLRVARYTIKWILSGCASSRTYCQRMRPLTGRRTSLACRTG